MPANNDSYVPLQRLYNSSNRVLQIIVREGDPDFAAQHSDVPIDVSRLVSLFPGKTLLIEPDRVDDAQLSRYQGRISIQIGRTTAIGVSPDPTPTIYIFNGTFYLECTSPIGLPTDNQERSMFGWVRPATVPAGRQALFGYGPPNTEPYQHNALVYNYNDRRDVEFWGSQFYYSSPSQNILSPDEWNFVGMSWSSNRLTMHVNNFWWSMPADSFTTAAGVFRVGFAMANPSQKFIGDIKSVSVWDAAKDYNFAKRLRESGPVTLNDVPDDLKRNADVTDCLAYQVAYKTVTLDTITPPENAEALEVTVGKEYAINDIQATQAEYLIDDMEVTYESGNSNITIMSKDYELNMLRTSSDDTISGSGGPDAFYARSKTMVPTLLEFSTRSALPTDSIQVFHDGSLSNLSSRSVSNTPIFTLNARVKDTPTYDQLRTSDGSALQFSSSTYNGLVSYWNLTETGSTYYDSVSNNDLTKIAV